MKVKLILDLGNSETRMYLKFIGKNGKVVLRRVNLSNRFYNLQPKYNVPSNYKPDKTTIMKIDGEYSGFYANGELVLKEFEKVCIRPTANSSKFSISSTLSFSLAVLKSMDIVHEEFPSENNVVFDVYCLLPPINCDDSAVEKLREEFEKVTKVTDYYRQDRTQMSVDIHIGDLVIYPEGFAAFIGCIYDRTLEVRQGYEDFEDSTVFVIDIGAGTTDFVVISGSEVIDNTRETFNAGGNNVRSILKRIVKNKYDYSNVLDSQLEEAMRTGRLEDGATYIDVSEDVKTAKQQVARSLIDDIRSFLEGINFSMRKVRGMLTVGGGSLGGDTKAIEPMSKYLVDYLAEFAPNIESIKYPVVTVKDNEGIKVPNEKAMVETIEISPRDLNIEGAFILSEVE